MRGDYITRVLTAEDEPILWEMLLHGLRSSPGESRPSRDAVRQPELAKYVEGWGRPGDRGFVASDVSDRQLLGAVWCRSSPKGVTPELAFVVTPGQRKRGIGAALLTQWVRTNPEQSEVSLRVQAGSPAVRLYERFGFRVAGETAGFVTMRREL
ncbi:hypothetical protein BH18VER1_BH18VER1_17300 [soil metagenome]